MLLTTGSKQFPHLAEFLAHAGHRPLHRRTPADGFNATILVIAAGLAFLGLQIPIWLAASAALAGIALTRIVAIHKASRGVTPEQLLQDEATTLSADMNECLKSRTLLRQLGTGTMTVLEECARHWSRAHRALASPFWTSEELPLHFRALRAQATQAVTSAMDELILLFRDQVRDTPKKLSAGEYVEEVVHEYLVKGRRSEDHLPVGFETARDLVDHLRSLADELESVARDSPSLSAGYRSNAGRVLDMCVGELRAVQEAENELRQY